jgi:hypothetical protein
MKNEFDILEKVYHDAHNLYQKGDRDEIAKQLGALEIAALDALIKDSEKLC